MFKKILKMYIKENWKTLLIVLITAPLISALTSWLLLQLLLPQ